MDDTLSLEDNEIQSKEEEQRLCGDESMSHFLNSIMSNYQKFCSIRRMRQYEIKYYNIKNYVLENDVSPFEKKRN